ncbi:ABC transporter permease subunit [Nocardia sp. R6R-6]|uniref:ABC transporter permease subunit n=1 Tax=Nocardia sp. R6R-6 TaxID=3459303 RepID=UPI00403DB700
MTAVEIPESVTTPTDPPGESRNTLSALHWTRKNWSVVLAAVVVGTVLLWAIVPQLFTSFDPLAVNPAQKLKPPSAEHWFGTDHLGRDLHARIVYGARASLLGSAIAVLVGVFVGSLLGAVAGWFAGFPDSLVMRLIDVVLSIPGFLLAITIVVLLGFGVWQAGIAVGLSSAATFARLLRSEVVKARTSTYVEAATTSGASTAAILRRHVIPNSIGPTVALITVQFGIAIIWIASLSFLGLGAQPPDPEWGRLVSDGRNYIATRGWLTLWPGLTLVAVVLATNRLSRHLTRSTSA